MSIILRNICITFVPVSCKWLGKSCNTEKDFVTTLTDLGVCYTFNSMEPALTLSEPGKQSLYPCLV